MEKLKFKYSLNIALNVRQAPKAVEFYQNTLGLGLVSLHEGEGCGIEMSAGPLALWIDDCRADKESDVGNVFFEFETNNLELARQTLADKGATFARETKGDNFRGFMVQDPFGMRFHVYAKNAGK
jgi:catechol 2,3-dioxygenase-like lactoylglutathione lyase family enzyme